MYILKIIGTRHNTLAYHQLESYGDLRDMLAIYAALGYKPEALVVEERHPEEQAA